MLSTQLVKKLFTVLMVVLVIFVGFRLVSQYVEDRQVDEQEAAIQQRLDQLKAEEKRLLEEKARLNDPAYIEKIAREEYNMVGKNEIPILIVPKGEEKTSK